MLKQTNNPRTGWNNCQEYHLLDLPDRRFSAKKRKNPLWVPTKGVKRPDHKGRRHLVGRLSRLVELHFRWKVY